MQVHHFISWFYKRYANEKTVFDVVIESKLFYLGSVEGLKIIDKYLI